MFKLVQTKCYDAYHGIPMYCLLSMILVARGTAGRPRYAVGITGSTGRSTGEHLHLTCRLNGKSVDPAILFEHVRRVQQECVSALAEL